MGGELRDPPIIDITFNTTEITSGESVEFYINTQNIAIGTTYYWSLTGDLVDDGLVDGATSGSFEIGESFELVRVKTKWAESFADIKALALEVRSVSTTGFVKATSDDVGVIYTLHPTDQQEWVGVGTYEWTVPDDVFFISGVAIGGGQGAYGEARSRGGMGGSLRWRNRIPVTPGEVLTIEVGDGGNRSTVFTERQGKNTVIRRGSEILLRAAGGANTDSSPITITLDENDRVVFPKDGPIVGGGEGGYPGPDAGNNGPTGGGGTGGYLGDGGVGGSPDSSARGGEQDSGAAGGGHYYYTESNDSHHATPGGGVGLKGQGPDGDPGTKNDPLEGGRAGSNGTHGTWTQAGLYGGGARGQSSNNTFGAVKGGAGALRLIWGPGRHFPKTLTNDM